MTFFHTLSDGDYVIKGYFFADPTPLNLSENLVMMCMPNIMITLCLIFFVN